MVKIFAIKHNYFIICHQIKDYSYSGTDIFLQFMQSVTKPDIALVNGFNVATEIIPPQYKDE